MKPIAEVALVQAADRAAELAGGVSGRRVVALAGKGHNGGDALEALARLARRGAGAEALLTHAPEELGEEERRCVRLVEAAGGRVRRFSPELAARLLDGADLAIDGLLGPGASGAPGAPPAAAIDAVRAARTPVVAVDIPSGVDGATGAVAAAAVAADVTVTFQAAKPGHLQPPGSGLVGRLLVADIGLPLEACAWGVSEAADLVGLVPVPHGELHKRSRGVLDAVGGCARWLDEAGAVALGPGLGRSAATGEAVRTLLDRYQGAAVVDADG